MQLNNTNKIQTLLNNAVSNKTFSTALIGDYILDDIVVFPENVTFILDRVNLIVKNNGQFVCENAKNVRIVAINNTIINLSEANADNNFIKFDDVENFEISSINFVNFNNNISIKSSTKGKLFNIIYK